MTSQEKRFAYTITSAFCLFAVGVCVATNYLIPNPQLECLKFILVGAAVFSALMAVMENQPSQS